MSAASLRLTELTVYRTGDDGTQQPVVSELSLELAPGACCMLCGPNGAGKTSLLLAMVGALPFAGRIEFGALELARASLETIRAQVGFVFANPDEQLFCETVWKEVAFGPRQRRLPTDEVEQRVQGALGRVGLAQHREKNPHHLSLGEQRRVAVATALANDPAIVLFDEPTASLDPVARDNMLEVLSEAAATLIIASHDLEAARELNAQVALLNRGRLVGIGDADSVLSNQELLGEAGLYRVRRRK